MNLIIDVGNTYIKLAVYSKNKLIKRLSANQDEFEKSIQDIFKSYTIDKGIVSSVGRLPKSAINALKKSTALLELNHNTKVPFKNLYATPKTLGVDRIALVSASVEQFPKNNVLIIDAGSCITYDFVNSKNEYLGGAISPGIRLRYKALHNFTANLPLLAKRQPKILIGNSTKTSIHSGVVFGIIKEIEGIVNEYETKYSDLTVILTGGDAKFLSKRLKSSIFANSNFLLEGLNYILEYNSK